MKKEMIKKIIVCLAKFMSKFICIQDVKIQIREQAIKAIEFAEAYVKGDGQAKKEVAIDYIMSKIKLPFFLAPFKGLIKKVFSDFIDNVIEDTLAKAKERVNY